MKESTTINIKVLARRVPPDYTSESLIIYNHVTNEKAFIGEEIRKQGIIVTETCSFSLCTRGEAEIMINTQNYRIKKNHLIIMLPKQVIKPIHTTPDYEARIIFISSDYFKEKCQEMIPLRFKMQYHPVVGLNEDEIKLLESYYSLLSRKTDKLNPHFSELAVHKLAHAYFMISTISFTAICKIKISSYHIPIAYSTVSSRSLKNIISKNVTLFSMRTNYT